MLKIARSVGKRLIADIGRDQYYRLENIVYAVEAQTVVDKVIYVGYNVPDTNPICGQFWKYTTLPTSYASQQTVVEVRYATHLTTEWRRFVVCKELCHSLYADEGTHSSTARSIDRILNSFALFSASQPVLSPSPAFDAETLAEFGAIELLCPLEIRLEKADEDPDILCAQYGIPRAYGRLAFESAFLDIIGAMD